MQRRPWRGGFERGDAPVGDLAHVDVEGGLVELHHVDADRLELARLLVERGREGEGEVAPAAVMLVGDGVDDRHRAGQRELELAAGMRPRRRASARVHRALAADRPDDGRHLGLVAVGADADHGLLAEIDAVEIGEEAVHEVHAGLLAVAHDVEPGILLQLHGEDGGVELRLLEVGA